MGRASKLKKMRQAAKEQPSPSLTPQNEADSAQFVKQLARQGYSLQDLQRSPELPEKKVEPQL